MTFTFKSSSPTLVSSFTQFDGNRQSVAQSADMTSIDFNQDGVNEVIFSSLDHSYSGVFSSHDTLENSFVHIFQFTKNKWIDVTSKILSDNKISGTVRIFTGDFNNDGKEDLFAPAQTDTNLFPLSDLFLSNAQGGYSKITYDFHSWDHGTYVTDINKDGYDDVLITDYGPNTGIAFGGPTGLTFIPLYDSAIAPNYTPPWGGSGICAADFLGNGTRTIIITDDSSTGYNSTKLYSWSLDINDNLSFSLVSTLPTPRFELDKWKSYGFDGFQGRFGASHDVRVLPFEFSGDGLVDAIVISRVALTNGIWPEYSEVQFLKNNGDGIFEDVTDDRLIGYNNASNASYQPHFIDINADGRTDIFLSADDFPSTSLTYHSTALLIQQTDGTFIEAGRDAFTKIWQDALNQAKKLTSNYVYQDWGQTMHLEKGADSNWYVFSDIVYADNNFLNKVMIFSTKLTLSQSGTNGDDTFLGISNSDTMIGGLGNDTYYVDAAKDAVTEKANEGTDTIISTVTYTLANNVENLTLSGSSAINAAGNSTNNIVIGNSATNSINGGLGNDTLTGGTGNDTFIFNSKLGATNIETITDFTSGTDKIALDDAIFTKLRGDKNLSDNLYIQSIPGISTQGTKDYLFYDFESGRLYYDADGSATKSAAVMIAIIGSATEIAATDFVII